MNEWVTEEQQRKLCDEYDLTMNEDLRKKFEEMRKLEEAVEQANANLSGK